MRKKKIISGLLNLSDGVATSLVEIRPDGSLKFYVELPDNKGYAELPAGDLEALLVLQNRIIENNQR